jgi:CubicO group peptidase (beta-lactamase class C family)
MFVDSGQLRWNAKIPELFPDITNIHPQFVDTTLSDLLAHRSGIGEDSLEQMLAGRDLDYPRAVELFLPNSLSVTQQRQGLAAVVFAHAPVYKPGSEFRYSNWNYIVAASIVERLSGLSWEDLIRSRIFEPLLMTSAGFGVPTSPGKVDQPWDHDAQTPLVASPAHPDVDIPQIFGPSSTIHCSLEDWGKFLTLFFDNGRRDLISQASINRITTAASPNGYAFGWFRQRRSGIAGDVLRHNGTNNSVFASALVVPQQDRAYLIVTNTFRLSPNTNVAGPMDQTLTKMAQTFPAIEKQLPP